MSLDDVLDLTPKTIWYLYERSFEHSARDRLMLVDDLTAVAAPTQFKDGAKVRQDHVRTLLSRAGIPQPS